VNDQGPARSPSARRRRETPDEAAAALDLIADAFNLLRAAPPSVLGAYGVGACPFLLAALYFWSDMSRNAFAHQRCFAASLGLAALFVWMKCWQAVFAAGVRAAAAGVPAAPWSLRRALRVAVVQTVLQPLGLLAIPAAMLLVAPFHVVHAFYQNVTALDDGTRADPRDLARRAMRQALLWPRQNCVILWLLSPWVLGTGLLAAFGAARLAVSLAPELHELHGFLWFFAAQAIIFVVVLPCCPFGCVVAGNVAATLVLLPGLLKSVLGLETVFTLSGWHALFNTTFLATVFALSYLCLDPILKAVHVLRCFHGESRTTGEDLLVELRRARAEEGR
jgi:hypothetical protein